MENNVLFVGGDRRIIYAAEYIGGKYPTVSLGLGEAEKPTGKYRYIVLPLPFSRDGICVNAPLSDEAIPLDVISEYADEGAVIFAGGSSLRLNDLCERSGAIAVDYFADEALTLKNAALTAEAAVAMLIDNTEFSLCGAKVLITGYGRIAAYTARLLHVFGADITICARKPDQRTKAALDLCEVAAMNMLAFYAESSDIIINTVPAALFGESDFHKMNPDTIYMELATRKAVPEMDFAAAAGVRYISASGLPGKFCPKTAGIAIADTVMDYINKLENSI